MAYQATGVAMKNARPTHFTKSLLSIAITSETVAPLTLRTPISFLFLFNVNETKPSKPKQAITMEMIEKRLTNFPNRTSVLYWLSNDSSRNAYSKGALLNFPQLDFTEANTVVTLSG